MKKILFLFLVSVSFVFGSGINWAKDYQSALVQSKASNKPVLMLVDRPNCPYCELLKEDIATSTSITNFINDNFIPLVVRQNDGSYPSDIFEVYGTPTTFFINPKGEAYVSPIIGYVEKEKYLRYLGMGLKAY
jgi:thioredoxin-related protein